MGEWPFFEHMVSPRFRSLDGGREFAHVLVFFFFFSNRQPKLPPLKEKQTEIPLHSPGHGKQAVPFVWGSETRACAILGSSNCPQINARYMKQGAKSGMNPRSSGMDVKGPSGAFKRGPLIQFTVLLFNH